MRLPSLLFSLLFTACFSVDSDRVILRCDADHLCPQGMVCLSNQTCGQGEIGDLGMGDGAADAGAGDGCTVPNGRAIGRAWACPVAMLSKNQASGLCATGFHLCTTGADLQSDPLCKTISGFYAADVIGTTGGSPESSQCQSTANPLQVFYGCGRIQVNTVYQVTTACQQLERAFDCNYAPNGWTCGRTLADTSTTVAAGVLCCPN